ncbi:MAG: hypothetical protein DRO36_05295 [Candidatus Hecatellales archaeon]|nr:MAG: hypothetical protein DRO36_05295 [Candidatus Hecatellales archaeon]
MLNMEGRILESNVKKMAEALKAGATMLEESCPQCSSPLFKLPSGEIYCLTCNRRVILVKSDEEALETGTPAALNLLEETLVKKLLELEQKIRVEEDTKNLQNHLNLTLSYLEALEKIRRIKR